MTEPLLRRLHERGERLTVGALPWVAPVYRLMPQVAEVIEFPFSHGGLQLKARCSLARQLAGRFDTDYICPNSMKSALLPLLAGIPKRVGYLGEARVGLLTHRLKSPPKAQRPPMVAFYSALSGATDAGVDRPQLQMDPVPLDVALALKRQAYVVFAPGAEYGPANAAIWPVKPRSPRPSASLQHQHVWSAMTPALCMWAPLWVCGKWPSLARAARCTHRP